MSGLVLVAGAGGFIGGQLVRALEEQGLSVRAVDRKPFENWYYASSRSEKLVCDLKEIDACRMATSGVEQVYNMAADMGGMGFIEHNKALCMLSVLIYPFAACGP
jgi:GDP-D-mannose 3', 5'-epimerase